MEAQQTRADIARKLRQRASQACYFKEKFEDMGLKTSAEMQATYEAIWNEAADIALGIRE